MARMRWNLTLLLLLLASVFWTSESVCPVPPSASQRRVLVAGLEQVSTSYERGAVLHLSCPPGHTLNGTNSNRIHGNATCSGSGRWDPYWPKCVVVKCPVLSVENGRPSLDKRRAGSNITIICNSGFVLGQSGSSTVMCLNNGSWNQTTPTCVPGCSSPRFNAGLQLRESYLLQESFRLGASVSYRCGLGYTRMGGSSIARCTPTGWTVPTLKCDRKSCGSAGEIDNGRYVYDEGVQFGSRVYAVCNQGHHLIGENTRLCTNDGWDGREAVCEPVQCPPPPPVLGAETWGPLEEPHLYSHVITYRCRSGQMVGAREIHCTQNGTWSAPPPRCTDVSCRKPVLRFGARNWSSKLNFRPGEHLDVSCEGGRQLRGPSRLTCGADGQWKPELPTCVWLSK